jgi:hypothetical protein
MPQHADWPVVVTNRCADACAEALDLPGREAARNWLYEQIDDWGEVVSELPPPMSGRRSPSGWFCLVPGRLVLPLAEDRTGRPQWIATNCLLFPRRGRRIDPQALSGAALLDQVAVLPHAVTRFQQRCGGPSDRDQAERELRRRLLPSARAQRQPPPWCATRDAEFFLVAGEHDEYCLPCRSGGGARPFDATTCIYRGSELFALTGADLRRQCVIDPAALPPGSRRRVELDAALSRGGRLRWHRPSAVRRGAARWWIEFDRRQAAPVDWRPDDARHPLLLTGFVDGRPWPLRLLARLLGR